MTTNNCINAPVPITPSNGGTGGVSFTAYMPICAGTTSTGTMQSISTGGASAGYVLTFNSTSSLPTWQAAGGGLPAITGDNQVLSSATGSASWTGQYFDDGIGLVFLGTGAGFTGSAATSNTAIGNGSLASENTGDFNTGCGFNTLVGQSAQTNNTAIGYNAGSSFDSGNSNTFVGSSSGVIHLAYTQCTLIGAGSDISANNLTNATAIGYNARVGQSNSIVLGAGANVGIGTSTPNTSSILELSSTTGSLLLPRLTDTQRNALTAAAGMVIYDTTASSLEFYNGSGWVVLAGGLPTISTNNQILSSGSGTAIWTSSFLDSGASNFNQFMGTSAGNATLSSTKNTSFGNLSLTSLTNGPQNTGFGYNTGHAWTTGSQNTAIGASAMETGASPSQCVAVGYNALNKEASATYNTAVGSDSMSTSNGSNKCTAVGGQALMALTNGNFNTALGYQAGLGFTTGTNNTAVGYQSFSSALTSSAGNTAIGSAAGSVRSSYTNCTFLGFGADASANSLTNSIAIGFNAAVGVSNSTVLGNSSTTTCTIFGISGATSTTGVAVLVNASGVLGTTTSSERFKHNIVDMNDNSSRVWNLRPVNFTYKEDSENILQWGLIAEEVEKIMPELVVYDQEGKPLTLMYQHIPVMLLNEMKILKQEIEVLKNNLSRMN